MTSRSAVVIGLTMSAAGAIAQAEAPSFSQIDANGDGQVTVEEASKHRVVLEQFNQLDGDGDGKLTRKEFAAIEQAPR